MEQFSRSELAVLRSNTQHEREVHFSEAFHRLVSRSAIRSEEIRIATLDEVMKGLALARVTLNVVDDETASTVYHHNSECFRIVRSENLASSPMMAYLPLNAKGVASLVASKFDAGNPKLDEICGPNEQPEAIYLWLMLTPGKMVSGLRLMKELEKLGKGCPLFTRPAHAESSRILERSGLLPASEFFPAAPTDLLVALSLGRQSPKAKRNLSVRVVRTMDDLNKVFMVRTATYVTEQDCSYEEEFDGNDLSGTHLLGEIDGEPAGCVRIRYFGNFAKLERLAVVPRHRRSRMMWKMVRAAFDFCARKGFTKLYAHARHDLVPAWERFGARLIDNRPPFYFSDVKFREMVLDLPAHPDAIGISCDPLQIIRPEGDWDRLGPIDQAQLVLNATRRDQNFDLRQQRELAAS